MHLRMGTERSVVLATLEWYCCFVYLDDILDASKTFEAHLLHIRLILDRLRKANLCLKLPKCLFLCEEAPYLGLVISKHGICLELFLLTGTHSPSAVLSLSLLPRLYLPHPFLSLSLTHSHFLSLFLSLTHTQVYTLYPLQPQHLHTHNYSRQSWRTPTQSLRST